MRIGFDFDGVLCLTPFGRLAVHAPSPVRRSAGGLRDAVRPGALVESAASRDRVSALRLAPSADAPRPRSCTDSRGAHEIYIVTGRSRAGEPLSGAG